MRKITVAGVVLVCCSASALLVPGIAGASNPSWNFPITHHKSQGVVGGYYCASAAANYHVVSPRKLIVQVNAKGPSTVSIEALARRTGNAAAYATGEIYSGRRGTQITVNANTKKVGGLSLAISAWIHR